MLSLSKHKTKSVFLLITYLAAFVSTFTVDTRPVTSTPLGACCGGSGCNILHEPECGGTFLGEGTSCDDCPVSTNADTSSTVSLEDPPCNVCTYPVDFWANPVFHFGGLTIEAEGFEEINVEDPDFVEEFLSNMHAVQIKFGTCSWPEGSFFDSPGTFHHISLEPYSLFIQHPLLSILTGQSHQDSPALKQYLGLRLNLANGFCDCSTTPCNKVKALDDYIQHLNTTFLYGNGFEDLDPCEEVQVCSCLCTESLLEGTYNCTWEGVLSAINDGNLYDEVCESGSYCEALSLETHMSIPVGWMWFWIILGIVVLVIIIAAIVMYTRRRHRRYSGYSSTNSSFRSIVN